MEELTSHFSCNMVCFSKQLSAYLLTYHQGADYKFGVVMETSHGFDTAPNPVMKALGRLTWGGATAVALTSDHVSTKQLSVDSSSMPVDFVDFNEQLMLGYFQGSQISVSSPAIHPPIPICPTFRNMTDALFIVPRRWRERTRPNCCDTFSRFTFGHAFPR